MFAFRRLFPDYLYEDSYGAAVIRLQEILWALGIGEEFDITCDADYGPKTRAGVRKLQLLSGFSDDAANGQLDPNTMATFAERKGIDLRKIPAEGEGEDCWTYWIDPDGKTNCWKPWQEEQEEGEEVFSADVVSGISDDKDEV